jgi:hypothetical protein
VTGVPASQRASEPAPPSSTSTSTSTRPAPAQHPHRPPRGRRATNTLTKPPAPGAPSSHAAGGLLFPRHPHAFPSSSLAYIANLSALTTITAHQRRVSRALL